MSRVRSLMSSPPKLLAAGALLLVLGLAACSDSDDPRAAPPEESSSPKPEEPAVCPLTGEAIPKGIKGSRPAVAIKIENSPAARPQSGLEKADLVYEELVEGGITRFMAIFHCGESSKVGPVRSARFDDPKLALPFTRVLGFSGANFIVERELKKRKLVALDEMNGGKAFFRDPLGSTDVHSLFSNTEKVRTRAPKKLGAPEQIFSFGEPAGKGKKARSVTLTFGSANTIEYRWVRGAWRRFEAGTPFRVTSGKQIAVPNLVVQQVKVSPDPHITDVAGNPSPDISLEGKGTALLFRDGKVFNGKWSMKGKNAIPRFTVAGGEEMTFERGPIWIELVPSKKGAIKGSITVK